MFTVFGEVESIVYRSADDDWSVLRVKLRKDAAKPMSKRGTVLGYTHCQPGQVIEADGDWRENGAYGRQFFAERIVASSPVTPHGLASYMVGALPGVGPKIAQRLVEHFGMDLLKVLDEDPKRVSEVAGIGPAKAARIVNGWEEQAAVRDIMLFLHSQQLPASLCRRIHRALGDKAVEILRANPYRLCTDVRGIGFKTADAIGLHLGIPKGSPQRVQAGLVYQMGQLTTIGNCGAKRWRFTATSAELLELPEDRVTEVLTEMLQVDARDAKFVMHDEVVYPIGLAKAEESIAEALCSAAQRKPFYAARVTPELVEQAARACDMILAANQAAAVNMGLTRSVAVITGGPGCGKTATLKVLLAAYQRLGLSVSLAAPTGKAAQRMREATGYEAATIHRLLRIGSRDAERPSVRADVLIVDEVSMVDVPLMARVVRALGAATLILVGDVDQLPSVGPGQVLADVIASGAVPVTVLDHVFRQATGSAIVTSAHAIQRGAVPVNTGRDSDFFVLTERNTRSICDAIRAPEEIRPATVAEAVARQIEELVCHRLPDAYHFDPIRDIQVLAPMRKGACGVTALNQRLQTLLNPHPARAIDHHGVRFGVGDKVIQCRNNYALDVYNGDIGYVVNVDLFNEERFLDVAIEGRTVSIPYDNLDELALAYVMTIHKSQGSQAPAVIVPMVTQHWVMLQRNLLYTGITRASRLAVVVGQYRALAAAVRTVDSTRRVTRLHSLLQEGAGDAAPGALRLAMPPVAGQQVPVGALAC